MTTHYFAQDGTYGSAEGLVTLNTDDWSADHWAYVESLSATERHLMAERSMLGYGSIDQQDCSYVVMNNDGSARDCSFVGYVYRHFEYPLQGEDGGYTWDCPDCGSENNYEGE